MSYSTGEKRNPAGETGNVKLHRRTPLLHLAGKLDGYPSAAADEVWWDTAGIRSVPVLQNLTVANKMEFSTLYSI